MFRTALRNVLAHKARLLMTVLAVLLGVAFVAGTLVFTSTISDAYQKSSEKGFTNVDVAINPDDADVKDNPGDAPKLSQSLLDQVTKLPGAESATGTVTGFAAIPDKDGKLVGDGFTSSGGNYFPSKDGKDARYTMKEGRGPTNVREVALDSRTADRADYKIGDSIDVSVDGPVLKQKVVGIFTTDDGNVAAGGSLALFDTKTAQKLYAEPGKFTGIELKAKPGTTQEALKAQVEKVLPDRTEVDTGDKLADDQAKDIENELSGMRTGMLAFAGIALFVGIFIIANTFTMLVAQRTKELALMRAVGASRRQVTRSVLIEATVVGSIAAVTGLLAGIGIGAGLRSLLNSSGATVPDGPLVITPTTIGASLFVGIVVTVLAAWLPGRRAAKIPPIAAMGSVHAPPTTRGLVVRNSIGALFAGVGIALVLAATTMDDGKGPMGLGAGLLMIGVFVLTPLLSRPLIAAAAPVLRIFGMPGKLARQNAVRNPRRTAATASALMIGLTLITGLTVIAGGIQNAIDKMARDSLKADYIVSMASMTPLAPEVGEKLEKQPEVEKSSPLRFSPSRVNGKKTELAGVNGKAIGDLTKLEFTEGSFAGLGGNRVVVDKDLAEDRGWKVGSSLPTTFEDGKKSRLVVSGIYEGNMIISGVMVDNATLTPHVKDIADFQVLLKTKDGLSDDTKESLEKALGDNPAIKVQTMDDVSNDIAKLINLMLNMLYGLLAMAVIVAVLGVVNTLAMSVFERSQEIGMLRAIGLDRKGIKRMVRLESLVISLFGGVLGIGLGVFFGWAAGELIGPSLGSYELVLPWGRMGLFLVLAALVGVLAALWPARRAAKLNMLAAIKAE
ncbi:ABC transporter permease [Streptomyces sp. AC536]|uniref:ABC transporter permease n=1 Tax=Streptomyces buecherae TaxID=2763006 RepID=UPI00164EA209|nr:ABC transporter permease [Streptomyces buecherae]MBC3984043.1 ABC transporter permease [Streptomyces buecherae]QNJ42120.1 ABC transporter permease [Streptomyces buecherae]